MRTFLDIPKMLGIVNTYERRRATHSALDDCIDQIREMQHVYSLINDKS